MSRFWEGLGKGLAERWLAVGTPALLFWTGALACRVLTHGGFSEVQMGADRFADQPGAVQVAVLVGALFAVAASGVLVTRLTLPALRFIEGYWPSWLSGLRLRLLARRTKKLRKLQQRWADLAKQVDDGDAAAADLDEYARLEQALRRVPSALHRRMPTRVGDILRSAERWPYDKYGLDPVVCWPRHWLLLPEHVRETLSQARASLDGAVAACLWGTLFVLFTPWAWPAVVIGPVVAGIAVSFWIPARAEVFGELIEASFDIYRWQLYEALRWPTPANPSEEAELGRALTTYLARGSDLPEPTFAGASTASAPS